MSLEVSIQHSTRMLKTVQLDTLTQDDYELVEQNAEDVEINLLNQIGIFY